MTQTILLIMLEMLCQKTVELRRKAQNVKEEAERLYPRDTLPVSARGTRAIASLATN